MVTALFGKIFHTYPAPEYADGMIDITEEPSGIGNRTSDTGSARSGPTGETDAEYADYISIQNTIDVVNQFAGTDTPFAVMTGLRKPHLPWIVPQEYYDLYPLDQIVAAGYPDDFFATLPPFALQFLDPASPRSTPARAIQAYLAAISFADAQGLWDSTTFVLFSDHGFHLGDHDNWGKFTLWEEAARAPLIIVDPGQDAAGVHVTTPVSLTQIFATISDLLGIPAPDSISSPSFAGLIDSSFGPYSESPVLTNVFGSLSMRWGDFRFIRYEDGSIELYNLTDDPGQTINIAANPAEIALVATCLGTLRETASAQGAIFDDVSGQLTGGAGDDRLIARNEVTHAIGGGGDDTYFIDAQTGVVEGADGGFDTVVLRAGLGSTTVRYTLPDNVEGYQDGIGVAIARIRGNSLSNVLTGTDGQSFSLGLKGNDALNGVKGEDKLFGGTGDDSLNGGVDNDVLVGGPGDDLLRGNTGSDKIVAGKGTDLIETGNGADRIVIRPGDGKEMIAHFSVLDGKTPLAADFDPSKDVLVFDGFAFSDAAEVLDSFVDQPNGAVLQAEGVRLTLWGVSVADLTSACIELIPAALDQGL